MKILQNSGVPIYQQIAESFRADILAGKYAQGDYLPSIRGLAKELKISVITTSRIKIRVMVFLWFLSAIAFLSGVDSHAVTRRSW